MWKTLVGFGTFGVVQAFVWAVAALTVDIEGMLAFVAGLVWVGLGLVASLILLVEVPGKLDEWMGEARPALRVGSKVAFYVLAAVGPFTICGLAWIAYCCLEMLAYMA